MALHDTVRRRRPPETHRMVEYAIRDTLAHRCYQQQLWRASGEWPGDACAGGCAPAEVDDDWWWGAAGRQVPIMLRSGYCSLNERSDKELTEMGECPYDAVRLLGTLTPLPSAAPAPSGCPGHRRCQAQCAARIVV